MVEQVLQEEEILLTESDILSEDDIIEAKRKMRISKEWRDLYKEFYNKSMELIEEFGGEGKARIVNTSGKFQMMDLIFLEM